jgi:uncharacterized protein with GYD domain
MTHSRNDVVTLVHAHYAQSRWVAVLEILDRYGKSYEQERERVQIAILNLSEGSEEKLAKNLANAKRDYRDVLFWSEYPAQSRIDSPEKINEVRNLFEVMGVKPPDDFPASIKDAPIKIPPVKITPEKIKEIRDQFKKLGITPPKDFPE